MIALSLQSADTDLHPAQPAFARASVNWRFWTDIKNPPLLICTLMSKFTLLTLSFYGVLQDRKAK